jgi:hypothetical protein
VGANGFKTHGLDSPDNRVRCTWDLATECVEECAAACPAAALHVFGHELLGYCPFGEYKHGFLGRIYEL